LSEQPDGVVVIVAFGMHSELRTANDVGRSDPRMYAHRDVSVFDIDRPIGDRFDDVGSIYELLGLGEATSPGLLIADLRFPGLANH
jgi:hypothetical protein